MTFASAVLNSFNETEARTANGMKARATSASAVLDFFGQVGSARGKNIAGAFHAALVENSELTIRSLLWARDIREGAGERKQFRDLLQELEVYDPEMAGRLMPKIVELGRWDDLFSYKNPANIAQAYSMIRHALVVEQNGLCAKWLPRKGVIAVALTKFLGLTPKEYRKLLVGLTKVVESQMCSKQWNEINFSHVPSVASARYQKAFGRNAPEAYAAYLAELKKPESLRDPKVKINAGAIFPYDIVKAVTLGNASAADSQWDALPNYVGEASVFPIVDTSGSMGTMSGYYPSKAIQPIEIAVSLGLYCAEKNTSVFKDMFMIFNTTPTLVVAKGTLSQRIKQLPQVNASSTNLHAAFDMLLDIAVKGNVKAEDMPKTLMIFSDMQFNQCVRFDDSAQEMIARKYSTAGYEVPKVVFWNLGIYADKSTPIRFDDKNVCHVSGFSPSMMKTVLADNMENYTPYNVMLQTIMKDRYAY